MICRIAVVVQEMGHLALAGNVLKAVGGTPKVYSTDIIPNYPADMVNRIPPLPLDLRAATRANIETFVQASNLSHSLAMRLSPLYAID